MGGDHSGEGSTSSMMMATSRNLVISYTIFSLIGILGFIMSFFF